MRPELLKLGGQDNLPSYIEKFNEALRNGPVTDVLENRVIFDEDRGDHVCMKSDDPVFNVGSRTEWSQTRAERIPWILPTLTDPDEIRPPNQVLRNQNFPKAMRYLRCFGSGPDDPEDGGYYCVTVSREKVGIVRFHTAFALTRPAWQNYKNTGPAIYKRSKGLLVTDKWKNT